ncbi:hypothetical protein [Halopenitus sp. POP-27]|uniref:hypothetical protein n=1 Tax=Halopenitus sp. POP-27 TaxID=2994425 RepID=UPI0024691C6A|nr:hypothetical protein [Halopenitus sp. POP-27]
MDADEIRYWSDCYDEVYDGDLREIEDRLNDALPERGYITRDQLEDVVRWKLNGQKGRRDLNIEKVNAVPDEFVRRVSEAAFLVDDPTLRLKTLQSIPGIGGATATVILRFYDPENYAIGDRYIVHELFGEDRGMRVTDYPKILKELRDRNPGGFDLRTVEKAYYQRYRDEHGVGDW